MARIKQELFCLWSLIFQQYAYTIFSVGHYRRTRKAAKGNKNYRCTPDKDYEYESGDDKKKDKKLVFLSKSVL